MLYAISALHSHLTQLIKSKETSFLILLLTLALLSKINIALDVTTTEYKRYVCLKVERSKGGKMPHEADVYSLLNRAGNNLFLKVSIFPNSLVLLCVF